MKNRKVKPTLAQPALPKTSSGATRVHAQPATSPIETDAAVPFQPVLRPSILTIEILDDGCDTGEVIRLRSNRTTIGRTNADILIPHDTQISGTHAEFVRAIVAGEPSWVLRDLNSTNGTFARVGKASLSEGQLILIGSHRYQMRGLTPPAGPSPEQQQSDATRGWQAVTPDMLSAISPRLVRLLPDGTEKEIPLSPQGTLGLERGCDIPLTDDPMVSTIHLAYTITDSKCTIEDQSSRNGTWLAIRERRLRTNAQIQIGEQRIRIRVSK